MQGPYYGQISEGLFAEGTLMNESLIRAED